MTKKRRQLGFKSISTKMPKMEGHKHFQGKDVSEHLYTARKKGAKATEEFHAAEISGSFFACVDSLKESSMLLTGLFILLLQFEISIKKIVTILAIFTLGWLFWKIGRSCLLGWSRLERLHRLIEEERWEIEHHRLQEKEELTAIYQQKGLSGKLLNQVIDVLMADDHRLLQIMLEEELGLTLESYEHPLKQGLGAGLGVIIASLAMGVGAFFGGFLGVIIALGILFSLATWLAAHRAGNERTSSLIWNIAVAVLAVGALHFIGQWALHVFH